MLDIEVTRTPINFMDCNYWSCFVHEDERLLLGGLNLLEFKTIRNIAQSENYSQYVTVLNMLETMLSGAILAGSKPTYDDVRCLRAMINVEIDSKKNQNDTFIPKYVQALFHHFSVTKTKILINLRNWKLHFAGHYKPLNKDMYGYKKFGKLFGYNDGVIDFNLLINLFPNLVSITIGDFAVGIADPSIDLSYDFVLKIFEFIEHLNKSSSSLSYSRFEIVKPCSSIDEFIESMKDEFEMNGWRLRKDAFVGQGMFSGLRSNEMLVIEKRKN